MTYTDDNHRAARILKDFDDRISNLEEASQTAENPNVLRTIFDEVLIEDVISETDVVIKTLEAGRWNNDDGGYQTSLWSQYD